MAAYRGKLHFVAKQRTLSRAEKDHILERDNHVCQYCGSDATQVDHILPHSWFPDNHRDNLVASCKTCNLIAGNKMFDRFSDKRFYVVSLLAKETIKAPLRVWTRADVLVLGHTLRTKMARECVIVDDEEQKARVEDLLHKRRVRLQRRTAELLRGAV